MAFIDIIVPTFGREDDTIACFQSVNATVWNARIIWVDNGSGEESREKVMQGCYGLNNLVPVWLDENIGFIKAVNTGLRLSTEVWKSDSDCLVVMNNDVVVFPGWLDLMLKIMDEHKKTAIAGPVTSDCSSWQSYRNVKKIVSSFNVPRDFDLMREDGRCSKLGSVYKWRSVPVSMVAFFCAVMRKKAILECGLLDEDFGLGLGDDDDYCYRMRKIGWQVRLAMGSYVWHRHRGTFSSMLNPVAIQDRQDKAHEIFKKKHGRKAVVNEVAE